MKWDVRKFNRLSAVLAGLMADRAWELPATGGSVLDRWPDIAAAVAFHPETGQLDPRPASSAYATQLRLITARIIAAANEAAGTEAVRTVRVLPPGAAPAPEAPAAAPDAPLISLVGGGCHSMPRRLNSEVAGTRRPGSPVLSRTRS